MSFDPKKFQQTHPIRPDEEFIVVFKEGIKRDDARGILSAVFAQHAHGRIVAELPGITGKDMTALVSDVSWDIVEDLKERAEVRSIGPNRRAFLA